MPITSRMNRSAAAMIKQYGIPVGNRTYHEATPAPTGETRLTDGQRMALLQRRGSDWSKAVLEKLRERGMPDATRADFDSLVVLGMAIPAGSFHNLTSHGRWHADQVAMKIARDAGMHVITYEFGSRHGMGALSKCTCGWRTPPMSKFAKDTMGRMGRAAHQHLEHVKATAAVGAWEL